MAAAGQAGRRAPAGRAHRRGTGLTRAAPWLIRRLQRSDLPALRPLRLAALRDHPEAFGVAYEEELEGGPSNDIARLVGDPPSVALGGFIDGRLVGTVCLMVPTRIKQRHKGHLSAVYVVPPWRGRGLARDLLNATVAQACAVGLASLTLSVTVGNEPARRLYLAAGFRCYGVEPRSLRIGTELLDEALMVLLLN